MPNNPQKCGSEGFSLMELVIAMTLTLTVVGICSTLIASGFNTRTRENQKSDALADTQRALNMISREIANAGFNLSSNGLVDADSGQTRIRIRSNLNKYDLTAPDPSRNSVTDPGEDIQYFINVADNTTYLARWDQFALTEQTQKTVLANRIDAFNIHYFNQRVTYTANYNDTDITLPSAGEVAPSLATYVVLSIAVTLNQVGTPGAPGYQPQSRVLLVSDVALRNNTLTTY